MIMDDRDLRPRHYRPNRLQRMIDRVLDVVLLAAGFALLGLKIWTIWHHLAGM